MKKAIFMMIIFSWCSISTAGLAGENAYVGTQTCKECHEKQYDNFKKYAKKARSFASIKKMENKLTPEEYKTCFECHTTGYKKKGGFVSEEKTPELMNAGCEVCHGPGAMHVENEDPDMINREIDMENCNTCHSKDRIEAFDFKPLLFGGAH